ncbi:MAG TPA: hypothetical protein VEH84_11665 [Alphaproteobacteria bacterium]|nr:hypothetical protein [Alphaproteobacteria bacterium]
MTVHRYTPQALSGDYLRAGIGLALTLPPLLLLPMAPVVAWVFAAGALLFGLFALRTVQRQLTAIVVDERGIALRGPLGRAIAWAELSDLRLSYFSTRRDRRGGWLQLRLSGGGRTLRIESTVQRFADIADQATEAARARGLLLSPTTVENLSSLGILVPQPDLP